MNPLANATLGVRTADGSIVPLLDFRLAVPGRAVFTTTADGQRRAVFDFFYRGAGATGWTYLDSLSLPHIPPARAGEPDLRLEAGLDPHGNLTLQMRDPSSSQPECFVLEAAMLQRLLRSQPGAARPASPAGSAASAASRASPSVTSAIPAARPVRGAKRPRLLLVALVLCAGFLAGGFALLRYHRGESGQRAPAVQAAAGALEAPQPQAEQVERPEPARGSLPVEATPKGPAPAARHPIAWGDTLWRIAERYYGERGLYRELAESNSLDDPDRIIAGQTLLLPPALAERKRKAQGE